jgi:hypothetical protein
LPEPKTQVQPGTDYTNETIRLVNEIRPSLISRYRSMPDSDLLIQGIVLVARKPVAAKQ